MAIKIKGVPLKEVAANIREEKKQAALAAGVSTNNAIIKRIKTGGIKSASQIDTKEVKQDANIRNTIATNQSLSTDPSQIIPSNNVSNPTGSAIGSSNPLPMDTTPMTGGGGGIDDTLAAKDSGETSISTDPKELGNVTVSASKFPIWAMIAIAAILMGIIVLVSLKSKKQ